MIEPLSNLILLDPIIKEKKTLVLTTKEESPKSYKVIAVGEKVSKIAVGDEVIVDYPRTIIYDDKALIYAPEDQIMFKVTQ
jgi:co-chaperonin GroES (HSP10)